jgi:hypothetical protein
MSESSAALDTIDYFDENNDNDVPTSRRIGKCKVFISSTYTDLQEERREIKQALEMSGYTVTGKD